MARVKFTGLGSKVYMGKSGAVPVLADRLHGVKVVGEIGGEFGVVDVTDLDSEIVEYEATLPDMGTVELTFTRRSGDTSYSDIVTAWKANDTNIFGITHPNVPSANIQFEAFITVVKESGRTVSDGMEYTATLQLKSHVTSFIEPIV